MEKKKMKEGTKVKLHALDRRAFLAASAAGLVAGTWPMGARAARQVSFLESQCGKGEVKAKVLLAYASRCGSTGEVAGAMAEELCKLGAACEVKLIKHVQNLSGYDAVIVGSAIRNFKWLPEAIKFVKEKENDLSGKKVAYFMTCLQVVPEQPAISLKGPPPKNETPEQRRQRVLSYLNPVLKKTPKVKPVDIGVFAGKLDLECLKRSEKAMMKSFGFVEGDFRDFSAIRAWAKAVGAKLI